MLSDVEMARLPAWKAFLYIGLMYVVLRRPVIVTAEELDRLRRQDELLKEVTPDLYRLPRLIEMPTSVRGYRDILRDRIRRRTRQHVITTVG